MGVLILAHFVVINNIISFSLTIAIVFISPIMIAYSGFLLVVNPVNPGGKNKAKDILLNTVIGIIVALSGWGLDKPAGEKLAGVAADYLAQRGPNLTIVPLSRGNSGRGERSRVVIDLVRIKDRP